MPGQTKQILVLYWAIVPNIFLLIHLTQAVLLRDLKDQVRGAQWQDGEDQRCYIFWVKNLELVLESYPLYFKPYDLYSHIK